MTGLLAMLTALWEVGTPTMQPLELPMSPRMILGAILAFFGSLIGFFAGS